MLSETTFITNEVLIKYTVKVSVVVLFNEVKEENPPTFAVTTRVF